MKLDRSIMNVAMLAMAILSVAVEPTSAQRPALVPGRVPGTAPMQDPKPAPLAKVLHVTLTDSSTVIASMKDDEPIQFATAHGKLKLDWTKLAQLTVAKANKRSQVLMRNGDRIHGSIINKTLRLTTLLGEVTVKREKIDQILIGTMHTIPLAVSRPVLTDGVRVEAVHVVPRKMFRPLPGMILAPVAYAGPQMPSSAVYRSDPVFSFFSSGSGGPAASPSPPVFTPYTVRPGAPSTVPPATVPPATVPPSTFTPARSR